MKELGQYNAFDLTGSNYEAELKRAIEGLVSDVTPPPSPEQPKRRFKLRFELVIALGVLIIGLIVVPRTSSNFFYPSGNTLYNNYSSRGYFNP